jgi:hypothetical protein
MNRGLRAGIPILYGAAVLIGFLISRKAGVITCVGGAVVASALYTIIARTSATPETSRRAPRNRDRFR